MKSLLILCLLSLACTFNSLKLSAQKTNSALNTTNGNTYAVIVGITVYKDPAIKALQFADRDAQQFSAFLQSKGGGDVPKKNIKLIVNKEATIAAIYDALDWLKEQCHKNDVAYIYFSGHGDVETKNNFSKGFLLAYNSPQNNYANNAIRVEDLNNTSIILTTKNKAKVILISDACHSGKLAGDFYKGKQLVASQLNLILNNQVRLASCGEKEEAAEGPNWGGGRGVFSYYLVMGLQGLADLRNDKTIELRDLTKYLDSSFNNDTYLIQNKHIQNPVTDGNPNYPLAIIDSATINSLKATIKENSLGDKDLPPGLMELEPLQPQPIDYFFASISSMPIESILDFDAYKTLDASVIPLKMVNDCIAYQNSILEEMATTSEEDFAKKKYIFFNSDSLNLLKKELRENKSTNKEFIEKFVQSVHDKGQDMISAYLKGDMDELERRQYYYSGKRDYRKYLSMLHIAMKVVPEKNTLSRILKVNNFYITGLIDRMQMATSPNTDSLLTLAFYNQNQALKMEPYAAYILNELGNLYLFKNNYDSAKYNFDLASVISPTWAIPWSNKIRLNMVFNKFKEAEKDFKTADSLQPNLAYVFTDAGMMMEKKGNLLAAESYFLRAIKLNNVHFLPFERLGYIYLNTGQYSKANDYLYQAQTRKKDFSIVPEFFGNGPALVSFSSLYNPNISMGCPNNLVPKNEITRQYIKLLLGLQKISEGNTGLKLLQEVLKYRPDMPLANHYLGKKYYELGEVALARKALEKSVSNYLPSAELWKRLTNDIFGKVISSKDSCQIQAFLPYQYDKLEDHYLLADIYEKLKENDKAFAQYREISTIENEQQLEQATYKNYAELVKNYKGLPKDLGDYIFLQTEKIVPMIGSIMAARLHEKLGEYEDAEKILLNQVLLNRAAGNRRLEAIRKNTPGSSSNSEFWLLSNSYLESETYNFYKSVLHLFPRDPVWQEKAGLFLYNRLASAFSQVPFDQQRAFYESIADYAYPWKPNLEQNLNYEFLIPGTGKNLMITATKFDPVKESFDALNISVKLSGDILPHTKVSIALADLNSWLGEEEEAIYWFKESLNLNPADVAQRNKFINYLDEINLLPDAYRQLDTLYRQKKIAKNQLLQLANWKWLSGENKGAETILDNLKVADANENRLILLLRTNMNMLSGNTQKAIQILLDTTTINNSNENNYQIQIDKKNQNNDRLYTIARLYAILQEDNEALSALKIALNSGFNYEYVIYYDTAWKDLRGSEKWKNLIKNPPLPLEEIEIPKINPLPFITPVDLH